MLQWLFKKDLEKNEMGSHYADAMEKAATYKAGIEKMHLP